MTNSTTGNQIVGIIVSLAVLFLIVWVISKAWSAGQ